jgi:hypothetical protein
VFAAWAIAPGCSGAFGAIIFLITKYGGSYFLFYIDWALDVFQDW